MSQPEANLLGPVGRNRSLPGPDDVADEQVADERERVADEREERLDALQERLDERSPRLRASSDARIDETLALLAEGREAVERSRARLDRARPPYGPVSDASIVSRPRSIGKPRGAHGTSILRSGSARRLPVASAVIT